MPALPRSYLALAAGLSVFAVAQTVGEGRGVAVGLLALAGTAALALAAWRPLAVAGAVALSATGQVPLHEGDPLFASFLAVMVALFALGRHASLRRLALGGGYMALTLAVLLVLDPRPFVPVELVFPLVYFGAGALAGRIVRAREMAGEAALAALAEEAALREQAALAGERARIAREMHDVVAHSVSLVVLQAESAAAILTTDPERAARQLDRVAVGGRQALDELRRLLGVLRTGDEQVHHSPQPTLTDLAALVETVQRTGPVVSLRVCSAARSLPAGLQLTAYRIVQEALTNAVRHGRPAHVQVDVELSDAVLTVCVADDGTGAGSGTSGFGLSGMRERVGLYGGQLTAGPGSTGGFEVAARLPVPA